MNIFVKSNFNKLSLKSNFKNLDGHRMLSETGFFHYFNSTIVTPVSPSP